LAAAFLLLLLVSLPVLAAGAPGEPWDDAGDTAVPAWAPISMAAHAGLTEPVLTPALLVPAALALPEYLSSRFGEKRPAGKESGLLLSALVLFIVTTALFAVPSCVFRQAAAISAAQDTRRYQP
jgi:hypothetical protein